MIPTMVSEPERKALEDYIERCWDGKGAVIEIGAFAGASAVAIMRGMGKRPNSVKLHVYDAFLFPKNDLEPIYRKLLPQCKGDSFRSAFDAHTDVWGKMLAVHEGDAAKAKWDGGTIAFMHIDCSISREFHEAVALEFYPHIAVGGVIAHQDYDYGRAPFIAEMMSKLQPWFAPFLHVVTTKYFSCTKQVSREELLVALAAPEKIAA